MRLLTFLFIIGFVSVVSTQYCFIETNMKSNHDLLYTKGKFLCKSCKNTYCVMYDGGSRKVAVIPNNITVNIQCMISHVSTLLNKKQDSRPLKYRIEEKFTRSALNNITNKCIIHTETKTQMTSPNTSVNVSFRAFFLGMYILCLCIFLFSTKSDSQNKNIHYRSEQRPINEKLSRIADKLNKIKEQNKINKQNRINEQNTIKEQNRINEQNTVVYPKVIVESDSESDSECDSDSSDNYSSDSD